MIIFFLFLTALIAFTFGFGLACVMFTSGDADRRAVDEFERYRRTIARDN